MSPSFPALLSAASRARTLRQLKQLHGKALHHAFHGRLNHWVAVLVARCARLRAPLSYARPLFDSAPRPNAHAFTSMLKYYSQVGAAHGEALALLSRMRDLGVPPDAFAFPFLVKNCSGGSVGSMHAHVMKLGHGADQYVRNAIMDAYARQGRMEVSRKLFDEISETTVVDWNTMVSGYWKWGQEAEARRMFDAMPERNIISWTAMVSGYSKVGEVGKARRTFDSMPERSVVSWNAMLSGYVQNGLAEEALKLFAQMMDAGVRPDETTWVTVVSACSSKGDLALAESLVGFLEERGMKLNCFVKTAMVDMYAKCGNLARARQIFGEMGNRNSVSWNAMISGYARVGNLAASRELFDTMPERNVVSWNSMISGYVQNGKWTTAIELFKSMSRMKDVRADEVTMVSIISACGHLGALETGRWVVDFVAQNKIELSISGYNALIFMYSRCGCMEDAERIFQEMPARDIISYNSLITGFATHGHGIEALELMKKMMEEGIEPDRITFIGVLTACSHAGLAAEGREVFGSIENPTVDHYACMVDLLGRAGQLDAAKKLMDDMPMEPHAGVYGALLNACRIHRRHDLGEHAAGKLFMLEPENAGNYVLLANIYASAGRWDDVENIRQMMRERGVNKMTGYSWVESGGQVHHFMAGDQSHPRIKDIYKVLEEYGRKMRGLGYSADKSWSLRDVEEEEKEEMVGTHSEKLAIGFALLVTEPGTVVRVVKNLRICGDCHVAIKLISQLSGRELLVRDNNRFHCFRDGECSCQDFW
ncbi:hypothetical protein Taro_008586 [Colocasia esculenta]|uniref:DYW domain-containing protein n=1 Tax=Colocasia esculenta TaxID=4460 RepID=A0A843TXL0_COLES|nr:hypothetical protein [Colocasia esculenta]